MFDDSLLDDESALRAADPRLRFLADAGARVRREATAAEEGLDTAVATWGGTRPRAIVAAGPDSRLLRAVLEPWCPVPFVAWPRPRLPGWVGGLDLVVVLAPEGSDRDTASAVAEGVRRGCSMVLATPPGSLVAEHGAGRQTALLPTVTGDQLAIAVVVLSLLEQMNLAPMVRPASVAEALDDVAVACSPFRDLAVNPAKNLASGIADTNPLLWGGSVLAARAARRVAESFRRSVGRTALAADAEHLLPVLQATREADVFADPFADDEGDRELRPSLVVFDDGADDPESREDRGTLQGEAERHGVRVERVATEADGDVARYASLLAIGTYAAEYLRIGLSGS